MKKAKIILTAIAVFAVIGGALAFKTARFNEFQLWTVVGTTLTTATTTLGGPTYAATIPYCKKTNFFATADGDILITNARLTVLGTVKATRIAGTETTIIPFIACPTIPPTFWTIII